MWTRSTLVWRKFKIPIPGACFSYMHVDLVDPLPASRDGTTYLLTMIDRSTRWLEAVPLGHIDVDTVLEAFITTWVAHFGVPACITTWVARFGVPARITTNRGTQFTSGTLGDWCPKQGVQHITTTAYHPKANGMLELAGQAGCSQGGVRCVGRRGSPTAAAGGAWSATAAQ